MTIEDITNLGPIAAGDVLSVIERVRGESDDLVKALTDRFRCFIILQPIEIASPIEKISRAEFVRIGEAMGLQIVDPQAANK